MSISRVLLLVLSLTLVSGLGGQSALAPPGSFHLKPIPASAVHHGSALVPLVRNKNGTSANWGGYAVATNLNAHKNRGVTDVQGTWMVPGLQASDSATTYSSAWIGIDGYDSHSVEQIGTEQDWSNGGASYYAWFELYPKTAYLIEDFPVNPGDVISAEVQATSRGWFTLSITNETENVQFSIDQRLNAGKGASAEWIVEAPWWGGVLPLADFGSVDFANCSATIMGHTGTINDPAWQHDAVVMESAADVVKAQPSVLSSDGSSFSVDWYHE